jgi:hypothetical protein
MAGSLQRPVIYHCINGGLDLSANSIDDKSAAALATGIAQNHTLYWLDLSMSRRVTTAGWMSIASSLQNPYLHLKQILLRCNDGINDDAAM